MRNQASFTDYEYSNRKRRTKREEFLDVMDEVIDWEEWTGLIMPYYPTGKRGRPTRGAEIMLRMYLLQNWFNLSDEGVEDAIYDSYAFRKFMGLNFMEEQTNRREHSMSIVQKLWRTVRKCSSLSRCVLTLIHR